MSKPPEDYNKLKAVWYKKLKDQGFHDIENDVGFLKTWSSHFSEKRVKELKEEREPYYDMATTFLNEYKFKNKLEKTIWEYHTSGLSCQKIAKALKKNEISNISYQSVFIVIKRLETLMKKLYLPSYSSNE